MILVGILTNHTLKFHRTVIEPYKKGCHGFFLCVLDNAPPWGVMSPPRAIMGILVELEDIADDR